MRLKKKEVNNQQRAEKIIISGKTLLLLDDYTRYYETVYHDKITTPDLILEMLSAFMKSDRDFLKWIKAKKFEENKNIING